MSNGAMGNSQMLCSKGPGFKLDAGSMLIRWMVSIKWMYKL